MNEGISIRKGPGTQYGWQGGFHKGTTIKIVGTSGSFYKVSYSGVTGNASKQYITIVVPVTNTIGGSVGAKAGNTPNSNPTAYNPGYSIFDAVHD